jgi:hypothetical protein
MKFGDFEHAHGRFTLYVDTDGDHLTDARFILGMVGEDEELLVQKFWKEEGKGDFLVIPVFAYGRPPRRHLCSPQSLRDALRTVRIEPNSAMEQQWKEVCDYHGVPWPKQKQKESSATPALKATA